MDILVILVSLWPWGDGVDLSDLAVKWMEMMEMELTY